MSEFSLTVTEREVAQNSKLTELRTSSKVPAVVYGPSLKPVSLEADYREIFNIVVEAGTSNIVELNLGTKKIRAIVKEYQTDPVTDKLSHVDFYAVDEKKKFVTTVPLEFVGKSTAVRELGGQLDQKNDNLTVKCLAADLPSVVNIDASKLVEIGQTILVEDLEISDKVEVMNNPKDPVANVIIPKKIKIKEDKPAEGEGVEGEGVEGEGVEGEATEGAEGADKPAEGEGAEGADKPAEGK